MRLSICVLASICLVFCCHIHAFLLPGNTHRSVLKRATTSLEMTAKFSDKKPVKIAVLGASGYTGAELVRLLLQHPCAKIDIMTADRNAGQPFSEVYPQFQYLSNLPILCKIDEVSEDQWKAVDMVFCCLPHATTQEVISTLPTHLKVVDLSADFRLSDVDVYEKWYGRPHGAPELQKEAVYGLTELARDQVKDARIVANPGCYPTPVQLALIPLLEKGLILKDDIIVDAKSGTTGAGRSPKQGVLYCEVTDGIHAYGIASHRHAPEIEQGLTKAGGGDEEVVINFTPHLMPMSRGILETIYVKNAPGVTTAELKSTLEAKYADETFVNILPGGNLPMTRHVRGSNYVFLNVFEDRVPGRSIIIGAEDNLVKGASGQAIQNMNVMCGLEESMGLTQPPMFP